MSTSKSPYAVVKHRYVTEKSTMLSTLHLSDKNPSVRRCEQPKYVFIVDKRANKIEIAHALEQIYAEKKIKVVSVNTIQVQGKMRRLRGRLGRRASFKKAIVTLEKGDSLD